MATKPSTPETNKHTPQTRKRAVGKPDAKRTKQAGPKSRPLETPGKDLRRHSKSNGRTMERVPIVCASDLPLCECCDEPWCPTHNEHYADCACIGPHNADELGYDVIEQNGQLYGIHRNTKRSITSSSL